MEMPKFCFLTAIVSLFSAALCVTPMGLNSVWRGDEEPRNQYEELADALLAVFVSFLQFFTSMDLALVESDPDLAEELIRFFTLQDAFG